MHKNLTFHLVDWWYIHTHRGVESWRSLQPKVFRLLLPPGHEWHMHVYNKKCRSNNVTLIRTMRRVLTSGTELHVCPKQGELLWCHHDLILNENSSKPKRLIWKNIIIKKTHGLPHELLVYREYISLSVYISGHHLFCHWISMQTFHW